MAVFVFKWYAVREARKWRYAVRKAKIRQYAVRKGGGGVTLMHRKSIRLCKTNDKPQTYQLQIHSLDEALSIYQ